jgi:hypothetical protein
MKRKRKEGVGQSECRKIALKRQNTLWDFYLMIENILLIKIMLYLTK